MQSGPGLVEAHLVEDPSDLLPLALGHPAEALAAADLLLRTSSDGRARTFALHALGIVMRDRGQLREASAALRAGLRLAERQGWNDRAADIGATLGTVLMYLGRNRQAESVFALAQSRATGVERARVRMRRAAVLAQHHGRHDEAVRELTAAARSFARYGDRRWEALARQNRALSWLHLGRLDRAEHDWEYSNAVFEELGEANSAMRSVHNLGYAALLKGDLVSALRLLSKARVAYLALGGESPVIHADLGEALLRAGLVVDANELLAESVAQLDALPDHQACFVARQATEVALAVGDLEAAAHRASLAVRAARRTGWAPDLARVQLLSAAVHARSAALSGRERTRLLEVVQNGRLPAADRVEAALLVAADHLRRGRRAEAAEVLEVVRRLRAPENPQVRSRAWHGWALRADALGRRPAEVLSACERSLQALEEHRRSLGAVELRAAITRHGAETSALALRHALRTGSPELLLRWAERWRATALALPPVSPPDDGELQRDLATLRRLQRAESDALSEGRPVGALRRERSLVEQAVRRRALLAAGDGAAADAFSVQRLSAGLGGARLVELVDIDGLLHALVVDEMEVRHHVVGDMDHGAREVDLARFTLHRVSRPSAGRAGELMARSAAAALAPTGQRLQEVLLGPAADDLGDGPVVVVPPGRLHAVPWGLLPALQGREVGVAPSASVWLQGRERRAPRGGGIVLVHGPDLGTGGAEVPALAELWESAQVLGDGSATAEAVLAAIDGAALAHLAAHGDFRTDNPMFSALRMDDGPLTVHDLGRLRRAPYRVVLSACESGLGTPTGADELLGLATALIPLGTAGLLASVVPVNDAATVPLMLAVHEHLRDGASLPQALLAARTAAAESGDPLAVATAAAFLALGSA
ncbi:MAG: CHAT domain-containing protein [Motilibacteraceae bacterium]